MTDTWHARKSNHNYDVYEYLKRKSPAYVDWEITALFYSACKLVDAYFVESGHEPPSSHVQWNVMVDNLLKDIKKQYGKLYDLSRTARYKKIVRIYDRDKAIRLHAHIVNRLSDRRNQNRRRRIRRGQRTD